MHASVLLCTCLIPTTYMRFAYPQNLHIVHFHHVLCNVSSSARGREVGVDIQHTRACQSGPASKIADFIKSGEREKERDSLFPLFRICIEMILAVQMPTFFIFLLFLPMFSNFLRACRLWQLGIQW